jgi:hypothetical protein
VKVTFAVPAAALWVALRLMLCGVPGVRLSVAGFAVTPAGKALTVTLTIPAKPLSATEETCTVCAVPPAVRARFGDETVSEKSGGEPEELEVL